MTDRAEEFLAPEARARIEIDRQLVRCGWVVQDYKAVNLYASPGVEVGLLGIGYADTENLEVGRRRTGTVYTWSLMSFELCSSCRTASSPRKWIGG